MTLKKTDGNKRCLAPCPQDQPCECREFYVIKPAMKKNQFKPQDFKYEPRRQQKQPLWLHSVQSYRTSRTTLGEVLIIVAIFAALALTWSILG